MAYARQGNLLRRLENENRRAMRQFEDQHVAATKRRWERAKVELRGTIVDQYRSDFGRSKWNHASAKSRGTFTKIRIASGEVLAGARNGILADTRAFLRDVRREHLLRAAWALDQVTPPGWAPKVEGVRVREAGASGQIRVLTGAEGAAAWENRMNVWFDAFADALYRNIELGSMNESDALDASDEVDLTRAGTPGLDMWNILERILRVQAIRAEAMADADFYYSNREGIETRVWQTMEDGRVCDLCDPLDQLEEGDTDEEPGEVHPLCRCFWRVMPRAWLDFVKQIDPDQAAGLRAAGLAPDAMAIYGDDGKVHAHAWVEYQQWRKDNADNLVGVP